MTNQFGPNELAVVKYLYNEATEDEVIRCELAMLNNRALYRHCQQLSDLQSKIDQINYEPSEACLEAIFAYSRQKQATVLSE